MSLPVLISLYVRSQFGSFAYLIYLPEGSFVEKFQVGLLYKDPLEEVPDDISLYSLFMP
jgi:hypothetical protein